MAVNRAYIVPLRNDLNGMGLYVYDLRPNNSQKNNVLEGNGQSSYLKFSFDAEADDQTVDVAEGLLSGSATTDTITALAAADVVAPAGNDSSLTQATEFGLKAYLRDRVHVNPGGAGDTLDQAQLNNLYDDIVALVAAGSDLTLAVINALLVTRAGANTDLDGSGALSQSFGAVDDIMRILSGEVYRLRTNTILADQAGAFMSAATRASRVANSTYASQVYASGGFLTSDDAGYRPMPQLVVTEALRLSAAGGVLAGFITGVPVLNRNRSYTGTTPTALRPAAVNPFTKATLPADGDAAICVVYDTAGNSIP